MRNKTFLIGAIFLAFLTGCTTQREEIYQPQIPTMEAQEREQEENTIQTIQYEQEQNYEIESPRVITLLASAAHVLYEIDANVVGVLTTQAQLPAGFDELPEVGSPMGPDLEIVVSLEPDVFILGNHLREAYENVLIDLGITPLFFLTSTYGGFLNSLREMGYHLNMENRVNEIVSEIENAIEYAISLRPEDVEAPTVAIIFSSGADSINLQTELSYVGDMVKALGGINITYGLEGGLQGTSIPFSLEQLLVLDPDFIIRFPHASIAEALATFDSLYTENPAFQQLTAVREGRMYTLDHTIFDVAANLRTAEAITILGEIFYGR